MIVFLFTVLAWNTSGQVNATDFSGFSKMPSCERDRLNIQAGGSCRVDVEQPKLLDEKSFKEESASSEDLFQTQVEASRSTTSDHQ
jgi:hypothetical protein